MEFALVMPIMLIVSFLALGGGLMVTRYLRRDSTGPQCR